jgi:HD-like signal output (HDOD) protein
MGSKKKFSDAIDHVADLFPNMTVLSRLSKALKDMNTELDELVPLIRTDAALTAQVIRISNTPVYRVGEPCKTVIDALSRIGFGEVLRVVSTVLAKDVCSHDLDKYGITADEFWEEVLTVSTLMEALAKRRKLNPADAATLGVLYALGRSVINNILEEFEVPILWDPSIEIAEWERAVVGFDYATAGGRIMKKWNFPNEIIYDVAFHLDPSKAPKERAMLNLLHYSIHLLPCIGHGYSRKSFKIPDDPYLVEMVDLDEEAVRQAIAEASISFVNLHHSVFAPE